MPGKPDESAMSNAYGKENAVSDTWDYKGRPADRAKTGGWKAAALILGIELCERLTTLGIAVNLVPYLVGTLHLTSARAANTVTDFLGTSFLLCLLGGFLADTYLGRYLTIIISSSVQVLGVCVLTISTTLPSLKPPQCKDKEKCEEAKGAQIGIIMLALLVMATGTGGIKSSVSGFGSDQFDETDSDEKLQMISFFNWFYFLISVGSLLAVTVLVYIQDNIGRSWAYGICAVTFTSAILVFLSGRRTYRHKKLSGSPLTQIAQVFAASWHNRHLSFPSHPSLLYDAEVPPKRKLNHTHQFLFLDKAELAVADDGNPWRRQSVTNVEEVKRILRMVPIWATTIMFWTVHVQMTTFSVQQASLMDTHIRRFSIPPASLTVFFIASILITVALYDRAVALTGRPRGFTPLQRIGVGLVLSALSMVSAALVESRRCRRHSHRPAMSVFWLVPQFVIVGAGEAFMYVGQLDFFIRESPDGMKSMSTGLFLSTLALGFFFSSFLVSLVDRITPAPGWLSDNLSSPNARLYDFYWLLALLSFVNLLLYLICAHWYVYKDVESGAKQAQSVQNDVDESAEHA